MTNHIIPRAVIFWSLSFPRLASAQYSFSTCQQLIDSIANGTYSIGNINNETIWQYVYTGPVYMLKNTFPRTQYFCITYEGCMEICGNNIALNDPQSAMTIAATWIFPLAILLSLPFESGTWATLAAISNWVGSPQTSLTATLFNVVQINRCYQVRRSRNADDDVQMWTDVHYVLSCFNQYRLPMGPKGDLDPTFLRAFVYGLLRPICKLSDAKDPLEVDEVKFTKELLSTLAFQLRIQRRRSVLPTLMSLAVFIASFGFSVAQAFADGGDSYPVLTLTSALLYAWLPMLVIFMIVDRNPNSSERSAELMSRWLFNADAVRTWAQGKERSENDPHAQRPGVAWWSPKSPRTRCFQVGDFVGHGRSMHYCGLVSTFVETTERKGWIKDPDFIRNVPEVLLLEETRPRSWYITASVSLLLIWTEIFLAVVVDFYTPTIGFGCWSGSIALYAILSMASWLVQFKKRPGRVSKAIAHVFNTLAIVWILAATMMVVTGATDTCYCNTCMLNRQLGFSKFEAIMDFETFEFDRDNFNVAWIWALGASLGGLLPIAVFSVALVWWVRCRDLWSADERKGPSIQYISPAWLQ